MRKHGAVRYYQKRTGPEIDFVIPDKGLAVEVKSRGNDRDMARLDKLAEAMGLAERYIVSREYTDGRGIIPATEI